MSLNRRVFVHVVLIASCAIGASSSACSSSAPVDGAGAGASPAGTSPLGTSAPPPAGSTPMGGADFAACTTSDALPASYDVTVASAVVSGTPVLYAAFALKAQSFEPLEIRRYTFAAGAGCALQRDVGFSGVSAIPTQLAADNAGQLWVQALENEFHLDRVVPGPSVRCTLDPAIATLDVARFAIAPDGSSGFVVMQDSDFKYTLAKLTVSASACSIAPFPTPPAKLPDFDTGIAIDAKGRLHWGSTFEVSIFDAAGAFVSSYLGENFAQIQAIVPCAAGLCIDGTIIGGSTTKVTYYCNADGVCQPHTPTAGSGTMAGTPATPPMYAVLDDTGGGSGPFAVTFVLGPTN